MKENVIGKKYGNIEIIGELERSSSKQRVVAFKCQCGNESKTLLLNIVSGNTKSCGCLRKKLVSIKRKTHGLSKTSIYRIFHGMKNRCFNKNNNAYKDYGGRGISVCKEWLDDFRKFYKFCLENGWKAELEIDRIDNDGWYSPENCRFVTSEINQKNKRLLLKSNTSGYRGVSRVGKHWKVTVSFNGKSHQKRGFKTPEDAAKYRDEFCIINKIDTPLNFKIEA